MRLGLILLLCMPLWVQAQEFDFDVSSYEKKPFELSGYLELTGEHVRLNRDAAFYNLTFDGDDQPGGLNRYSGVMELEGLYRFDRSSFHFRGHAEVRGDDFGSRRQTNLHELYYAARPSDRLTLEAGKRVLKWGKGYAWNPVGFVERPKDPNDPDLTREGFVLATADYVRSFDGPLKTLAFTPVILPVGKDINDDFSREKGVSLAARLYLLYRDTDIDFLFLSDGSRSGAVGMDFSRNLAANFEVHGELAYTLNRIVAALDEQDRLVTDTRDVTSGLLGMRYLTKGNITWIAEVPQRRRLQQCRAEAFLRSGPFEPRNHAGSVRIGGKGPQRRLRRAEPGPRLSLPARHQERALRHGLPHRGLHKHRQSAGRELLRHPGGRLYGIQERRGTP